MAALGKMKDGVVKKFSDGALTLKGGAATPNEITVKLEEGTFSYTEKDSFIWHKERGILDHRRKGESEPIDVSFSAKYTGFYSSTADTVSPYEAITGRGQAAPGGGDEWASTTAASSDVHSVHVTLTYTDIDGSTETIKFWHFASKTITFTEGEEQNVIEFTGDAVGTETDPFKTYPQIGGAAAP